MKPILIASCMLLFISACSGGDGAGSDDLSASESETTSTNTNEGEVTCKVVDDATCYKSSSNYNGDYILVTTLNTCEDHISFRDKVTISNASIVGYTWTDEDGQFFGKAQTISDSGYPIYQANLLPLPTVCVATFLTIEDTKTQKSADTLRVICGNKNFTCQTYYAKP